MTNGPFGNLNADLTGATITPTGGAPSNMADVAATANSAQTIAAAAQATATAASPRSAAQLAPRLSNQLSMCVVPSAPATISAGYTISTLWTLESSVDAGWVRLVYMNDSAAAYTISATAISPSSEINDGYTPKDGTGTNNQTLWTNVTFNNGGANVQPWNQTAGSVATITVPANPNANVAIPALTYSDWMYFSPLARLDGTTGLPLLLARTYYASGGRADNVGSPSPSAINPITGRDFISNHSNSNGVATPSSFSVAGTGYVAPYMVEYYSKVPGATLLSIGDSTIQGFQSTSFVCGFSMRAAAAISSPALPISSLAQGWTGQIVENYIPRGIIANNALQPQFTLILVASQNDPITAAQQDTSWLLAMQAVQAARSVGSTPILVTPTPWPSCTTTTLESYRLINLNRAKASGLPVVDYNAIVGNGGNPATLLPQYNSGDNKHVNDAGNAAVAAVLAPMLAAMLVH
jgi:hypothetical protein